MQGTVDTLCCTWFQLIMHLVLKVCILYGLKAAVHPQLQLKLMGCLTTTVLDQSSCVSSVMGATKPNCSPTMQMHIWLVSHSSSCSVLRLQLTQIGGGLEWGSRVRGACGRQCWGWRTPAAAPS